MCFLMKEHSLLAWDIQVTDADGDAYDVNGNTA